MFEKLIIFFEAKEENIICYKTIRHAQQQKGPCKTLPDWNGFITSNILSEIHFYVIMGTS